MKIDEETEQALRGRADWATECYADGRDFLARKLLESNERIRAYILAQPEPKQEQKQLTLFNI